MLPPMTVQNMFAGDPLDRAAALRRDDDWVRAQMAAPTTRFLILRDMLIPVTGENPLSLVWGTRDDVPEASEFVLLGLEEGEARFAVAADATPGHEGYADLRMIASQLPADAAATASYARALLSWHVNAQFCPRCGGPTVLRAAGGSRRCQQCEASHHPRIEPVVIMLVTNGTRCLLGSRTAGPEGRYSTLAGFLEPGETIEEAVRREVWEESGVVVGDVRYHSSQPWPFPSNLMIGCMAEALTTDAEADGDELADARWFTRAEVRPILGQPQGAFPIFLPPPTAIAHQLIKTWLDAGD
jgi:NAD+ diphosphatase